jgi:mycothiol synthase
MAVRMRAYSATSDAEQISALLSEIDRLDVVQGIRRARAAQELRAWFESPELQPEDMIIWEDQRGRVRGYGLLECSWHGQQQETLLGELRFNTHPANREDDLDSKTIAWAEKRLLARGADAKRIELQSNAANQNAKRIFTLKWHGFTAVRHFVNMRRDLSTPLAPRALPHGFTVRRHDFECEAEAWIALYDNAFAQHWQFTPVTLESYFHFRRHDPRFQPDHNWIVLAPDGTFAAFCWCLFNREQLAEQTVRDALLHQIGTHSAWRGIGLASALIQHTLDALRADLIALHGVRLWVDIENVTNAKRLYEAHGFQDDHTLVFYQKVLKA